VLGEWGLFVGVFVFLGGCGVLLQVMIICFLGFLRQLPTNLNHEGGCSNEYPCSIERRAFRNERGDGIENFVA